MNVWKPGDIIWVTPVTHSRNNFFHDFTQQTVQALLALFIDFIILDEVHTVMSPY